MEPNVINLYDDSSSDEEQKYASAVVAHPAGGRRERKRKLQSDAVDASLRYVLEVFPDASRTFIQKLLQENNNSAEAVILAMVEKSYPKESVVENPTEKRMGKSEEINYMSTESFRPSRTYVREVEQLLLHQFSFLTVQGARTVLQQSMYHYAVAHGRVWQAAKGRSTDKVEQYTRIKTIQTHHFKFFDELQQSLGKRSILKTARRKKDVSVTDSVLKDERSYVAEKVHVWMEETKILHQRAVNKKKVESDGTGMECSCCFDVFPIEDMVGCRAEGHLFCMECVQNYTEAQVFGQGNLGINPETKKLALELHCFHSVGCNSWFDRNLLLKALPAATLSEYDRVQGAMNMKSAGLADMVYSCPECDFRAEIFPTLRVFACPQCAHESCTECREPSHIPMGCEEAANDKQQENGRKSVEEAISSALIRKCPSCKKPFIKESGCNKITCGCGTKSCYLCRMVVHDYTHFCQTPHCTHQNCTKCPLYSNDAQDAQRDMREAGLAAARKGKVDETMVEHIMKKKKK